MNDGSAAGATRVHNSNNTMSCITNMTCYVDLTFNARLGWYNPSRGSRPRARAREDVTRPAAFRSNRIGPDAKNGLLVLCLLSM